MISIIIPAYNIEKYIESCLESIRNQTYNNIEIIVVDDGSSDKTPIILDEIAKKDNRIVIIHKEHSGVTSSRLRGVEVSRGEWIGFVDGDDWIEPEMYEHLLNNAILFDADLSHCGYQMVFPNRVDYYYNTGRVLKQNKEEALVALLSGEVEPSLCNKLFRKQLFDGFFQKGYHGEGIRNNEDLLMNYYLFNASHIVIFEDCCLYHYRVRLGSAANRMITPYIINDQEKVQRILVKETQSNYKMNAICQERLIMHLIRVSTKAKSEKNREIWECIVEARIALQKEIPRFIRNKYCSKKLKFFSLWVVIWPDSYRWVHHLYGEITGANHKYDIN